MASAYPGALDTFATNKADATATATDHAAHHNDLADAINKIEAELGTNPSLGSATVSALMGSLVAKWIPVFHGHINFGATATGTYPAHSTVTSGATATTLAFSLLTQYLDPAQYGITGFTPQCRIVANFQQNAVANAPTSVTTVGLYPVTPAGATTTWAPTLGTLVANSTAQQIGGAAGSDNQVVSATFPMPVADSYTIAAVVSVLARAGGGRVNVRLEYRYA